MGYIGDGRAEDAGDLSENLSSSSVPVVEVSSAEAMVGSRRGVGGARGGLLGLFWLFEFVLRFQMSFRAR